MFTSLPAYECFLCNKPPVVLSYCCKPHDCLVAIHKLWDLSLSLVLIKPPSEEKCIPSPDLLNCIQLCESNPAE